ncbi:c-type cytochrome [Mameliella sediminis]|uniref:c-type cytochrome n=1 Tax=Mameliella sediminis TaxID=2836866 RepID=UPI001C48B128|nr:c-type cytochrome [Mameliella sediminis]MBV7396338.1 c-type cytochrome [Mameliella sediminis]MBY6160750.1 c-type cytochrome [Mameliella alba]MBY6169220.1 c-type cytochrome [Mameliella alba]MBY6173559.1 c-type cytochrome [Mameliella alba]
MKLKMILATAVLVIGAQGGLADESDLVLGRSTYGALCSVCHGADGKGGGEIAALFKIPPTDLTKLSETAGGDFPFVRVYNTIARGMGKAGHGEAEMPVWGDFFIADELENRGVHKGDAVAIAAGRIFTLAIYLESIQE